MSRPAHLPLPLPSRATFARDPEAAWDAIEASAARAAVTYIPARIFPSVSGYRPRPRGPRAGQWVRAAAWCEEAIREVDRKRRERERLAEDARLRLQVDAIRAQQSGGGQGGSKGHGPASPRDRAAACLAVVQTGPRGLADACLVAVRGFALGEHEGAALVWLEYAPRYHRKLREREVRDKARWAARAGRLEWGGMLRR